MIRNNLLPGKIYAVLGFAKNDIESATLSKFVKEYLGNPEYDECNIIYITAKTPLGSDLYARYKDKNLNQLMEFSKVARVEEKVRRYMEVLL